MSKLASEYTDMKNVKHTVTHQILPVDDKSDRERIVEELLNILSKQKNKNSV